MVAALNSVWKSPTSSFRKQFPLELKRKYLRGLRSYSFLVRGFFLYLTFTPHAFFLSSAGSISTLRGPVTFSLFSNPVQTPKTIALSSLWAQWGSFFNVVTSLAGAKVTFLWGGSSELFYFSHALSWFSWRASFVAWRLYSLAHQLPTHTESTLFCTLFFSDSKTKFMRLRPQTHTPLLGVGDFSAKWASWAYVYSVTTSRPLQLLFLGCIAKSLALGA